MFWKLNRDIESAELTKKEKIPMYNHYRSRYDYI